MKFTLNFFKIFILLILIELYGCIILSFNESINSGPKIIVEGFDTLYQTTWHTEKDFFHSGYILKDPSWITPSPETNHKIFLEKDSSIAKYCNKRVHVEGTYVSVPAKYLEFGDIMHPYIAIFVDTIYVIE